MNFTIGERIALLSILPAEGNIVTLRVIKELRTELGFTEDEIKKCRISNHMQPDGKAYVTWDSDFSKTVKDVTIGDVAKGIIVESLKILEEQKKLRLELFDLYEKFVESKS